MASNNSNMEMVRADIYVVGNVVCTVTVNNGNMGMVCADIYVVGNVVCMVTGNNSNMGMVCADIYVVGNVVCMVTVNNSNNTQIVLKSPGTLKLALCVALLISTIIYRNTNKQH